MLVDDHLVVRRGLASLLDDEPDFAVVAEAGTAEEAIERFDPTGVDVAIVDLRLPDRSGVEVAAELARRSDGLRVMILSSFVREEDVRRAFETGVLGYVAKDASSEELIRAIREVGAGRPWLPPEVSLLLARSASAGHLSDRETEVLELVAAGCANKEIGSRLGVSENTVKNHLKSILTKLQARDRTHAVTEALRRGLLQLEGR